MGCSTCSKNKSKKQKKESKKQRQEQERHRQEQSQKRQTGVSDPHNHGILMSHVLIVEDEAHLAKGLQYNLEAEGHSVSVVGDGERALELLLGKSSAPSA